MKILGVDYGRSKIGLAIAEGPLAEPLSVVRVGSMADAVEKIRKVSEVNEVEKVIVGISENQIADEQRSFAQKLRESGLDVIEWDETLSTQDAQAFAIQSGVGQKKRREMEDAFAAAIVVQSFLDNQ